MDPISIPAWVPASVASRIRNFETWILTDEQHAMLVRLATDAKMRDVWTKLLSRHRGKGGFCYPAIIGGDGLLADYAQREAIGDLFMFCFATIKDRRASTTEKENDRQRADLRNKAFMLKGIAGDLRYSNINGPHDVEREAATLERVAKWLEGGANELRSVGDPLTVERHRQDPIADGAMRDCLGHIERLFSGRLPGLAADIVSVGTGLKVSRDTGRRLKGGPKDA